VSTSAPGNSGKLLIIAVVTVAFAAAGAGWWFRYSATHLAAKFWGPEAVLLIRDASNVTLIRSGASTDVTQAHGLTHLRYALLEDRSFNWPPTETPSASEWTTRLCFANSPSEGAPAFAIAFSADSLWATATNANGEPIGSAISCEPISKGLSEVFTEWSAAPAR
jgi:hypothetical protein